MIFIYEHFLLVLGSSLWRKISRQVGQEDMVRSFDERYKTFTGETVVLIT